MSLKMLHYCPHCGDVKYFEKASNLKLPCSRCLAGITGPYFIPIEEEIESVPIGHMCPKCNELHVTGASSID